jgi:hypothetical protein
MKKLLMLIFFLNIAHASQTIQIQAHLPNNSPDANFLFIIDDSDTGTKTAASMYLHAGQNLATFSVSGDHYQVIPATLQAPNMQFTPCIPTSLISNHSLIVTITGEIAPNQLTCAYRETAMLPQLYTPVAAAVAPAANNLTATTMTSEPKAAPLEMANYLTALSQDCKQGDFHMNYVTAKADYIILGMKSGACEVSIETSATDKSLLCHFTPSDIALMASPSRIAQAQQGNTQYSANDLTANIMKARCH